MPPFIEALTGQAEELEAHRAASKDRSAASPGERGMLLGRPDWIQVIPHASNPIGEATQQLLLLAIDRILEDHATTDRALESQIGFFVGNVQRAGLLVDALYKRGKI